MINIQTIRVFYVLLAITLLSLAGCKKTYNPVLPEITGALTNYTGCKNEKSGSVSIDWDTNFCFLFSYEIDSMLLHMRHLNAIFNCCNFGLYSTIEEVDDTIIIREFENGDYCSCVCEYDLDFVCSGVQKKLYWIKLVVPKDYYISSENPLIFSMDFTLNNEGEYCW